MIINRIYETQNLLNVWWLHVNGDDRGVETVVRRWLMTEDTDWCQCCIDISSASMTSALITAATVRKTREISVWLDRNCSYRGADKSIAQPTSWCILFDGENISFDASLVIQGFPRVHYFRRVFLMLKYTDTTPNTYIQSWTVTEIMAREVWKYGSCYTLTDCQIHIETGRNMWFL